MPTYNNGAGYFLYVRDISEVYNYQVPQGQTMFFMNKEKPILYLKAVNMFNQQNITAYDIVEQPQYTQTQNTVPNIQNGQQSEYVKRDELSAIIAEAIHNEFKNNRGYNKSKRSEES